MFFDNWYGLVRPAVVGVLAYAGLILVLRASGKRTLSKMNAFDLVVTMALGSTLATALLTEDVALAEGLVGFGVLILLQWVVSWLSVRSPAVRRLVRSEPTLLYFRGRFVDRALRGQRVTEGEVYQAVRSSGRAGMDGVEAVVLEADGTLSVVSADDGPATALRDIPTGHLGAVGPPAATLPQGAR